ncbi:MAG: Efflux ABC transporter, ATP-binding protein [Ktedonobacterales bacterium]|jgi:ABC-2 type transport system ATP-binding protein|nr:MAG: Efflux ABC transporter, ATP-binding protein [Ktedonobacterales bacterium]
MAMIETHGLTKTFRARGKTVEAVRGVDLMVRDGEIFGFLGPNGAGKTTTMRMLATLLEPTGGKATVCGYDLRREAGKVRTRIGYVGQNGGAEPLETGRENLILQGRVYGMGKAGAVKRAAELITRLDMEPFADRLVRTYSGGQRRRLDVALGIMHRPHLLFLDEPTTGLDPQSRVRIWDEVRRLCADGMTIFLTTHYMDEADGLCNRLAIMDNGKIASEDTPNALKQQIAGDIISLGLDTHNGAVARASDALREQPYLRELQPTEHGVQLYVDRGEEVLPEILRQLDQAGAPIRTVTLARPTLEDVFLRLTGRSLRESADIA